MLSWESCLLASVCLSVKWGHYYSKQNNVNIVLIKENANGIHMFAVYHV